MSDHATSAVAEGHAEAGSVPADGLRFEKSELDFFVEDDRATGGKLGKMLALIFLVLVVLMGGVAIWTNTHQSVSQDPFATPHQSTSPGGH